MLQAIRSPRALQGIEAIYYLTKNVPTARLANLVGFLPFLSMGTKDNGGSERILTT